MLAGPFGEKNYTMHFVQQNGRRHIGLIQWSLKIGAKKSGGGVYRCWIFNNKTQDCFPGMITFICH